MRVIDETGNRYGRLVVVERGENNHRGNARWICRCDCGKYKTVLASSLAQSKTNSCGCLKREITGQMSRKHGLSQDGNGRKKRLYRIWKQMRQRCLNPNDTAYDRYGGNGVTICRDWDSYENFHKWALANGYRPGLTIDRKDNAGNYDPGNCRWASYKEQSRNRSITKIIVFNGKARPLGEWAELLGISYGTLRSRLRLGWKPEKALTAPVRGKSRETVKANTA